MDLKDEGLGVVGDEQNHLQVHHLAAIPRQDLEGELQNLDNNCNEDRGNDEVEIIFEGPQQQRVTVVPPLGRQPEGIAPAPPAGFPIGNALEELRALEMRFGVQNEDEGCVSGGENDDREPLNERLRVMEPQLLERPLINLDFEMMEISQGQEAQDNREPILIENEQPNWGRPPFLIEVHLGEFGNSLPMELVELERAPAPGLFEAIAPFLAPLMPVGPGA
ncbi:hypothetical protein QAD02_007961 [Eretmocerus hayati]|uniref:Uncharacterized protein n=1 Tax=Eretmocerus hayati TaxID=131215 RepID=A0ACC2N5G3_9HYME|nr:hypothetical protein QAD02_007961 [Eretmocerus hayati]